MSHAKNILAYHFNLEQKIQTIKLPMKVEWLIPYNSEQTKSAMAQFYHQYYADNEPSYLELIREDLEQDLPASLLQIQKNFLKSFILKIHFLKSQSFPLILFIL
jgi:hypothetical protein